MARNYAGTTATIRAERDGRNSSLISFQQSWKEAASCQTCNKRETVENLAALFAINTAADAGKCEEAKDRYANL